MIKESEADNFFKQKDLPDGTYAVLGSYSYDTNSDTDETEYYYSFDLSSLLAYEFKNSHEGSAIPEEEKYLLIPVRVSYNSSSSITKIMPQYIMSAVTVCAGNHSYKPMKARVVYSGF